MNRMDKMRSLLAALQPAQLEIADDSHLHAGHAGTRDGGGHYRINIVSARFIGKVHWQIYRGKAPYDIFCARGDDETRDSCAKHNQRLA